MRKLKDGKAGLVLQVCDVFLAFKKFSRKMEATYPNLQTFEKKLYGYKIIEDLHYKLLNIMQLIIQMDGFIASAVNIRDVSLITIVYEDFVHFVECQII